MVKGTTCLLENPSLIPSKNVRWFTTTVSPLHMIWPPSLASVGMCIHMTYIYTDKHIKIEMKARKLKVLNKKGFLCLPPVYVREKWVSTWIVSLYYCVILYASSHSSWVWRTHWIPLGLFVKIFTEGQVFLKNFEGCRPQGHRCSRLLDGVGWSSLTLDQDLTSLFHDRTDSKYASFVDHSQLLSSAIVGWKQL